MISKILWYLLFLCISTALLVVFGSLFKISETRTKQSFWVNEAMAAVAAAMLYFYSLLLARFPSFLIAGFYFLALQVPILVDAAFRAATVGGTPGSYEAEMRWAVKCHSMRQQWLYVGEAAVTVVVVGVSSLVAGIVYFTAPIPSTAETLTIIRISMLSQFLVGSVIYLPSVVAISLSENLSTAARRHRLGVSLAELVPTGMILATLLWTFSSSARAPVHTAVKFHLTYFPVILSILATYFLITFLLPYLIGFSRGAQWQSELLERRTETVIETIKVLRVPKVGFHTPTLSALVAGLQAQRAEYITSDKSIEFGLKRDRLRAERNASPPDVIHRTPSTIHRTPSTLGDGDDAGPHPAAWDAPGFYRMTSDSAEGRPQPRGEEMGPTESDEDLLEILGGKFNDRDYYLARPQDPRFQYLDWLHSLIERLLMTASDLQTRRESAAELSAALAWADSYDHDRSELREKARRPRPNAAGVAIASTLVTSMLSVVFTSFGSWLWTYVAQTLPN